MYIIIKQLLKMRKEKIKKKLCEKLKIEFDQEENTYGKQACEKIPDNLSFHVTATLSASR